jgi:Domain of unknown function (DUF4189)
VHIRIFIATFLLLATLRPISTAAEGALAIGLPANVAKEGVALGWAVNFATKAEAELEALKECLAHMNAPASTRALCKVTERVHDQCVGIALDPKDGTPGVGWAIAADSKTAQSQAMAKCSATAGPSRRDFCVPKQTRCDGSAK